MVRTNDESVQSAYTRLDIAADGRETLSLSANRRRPESSSKLLRAGPSPKTWNLQRRCGHSWSRSAAASMKRSTRLTSARRPAIPTCVAPGSSALNSATPLSARTASTSTPFSITTIFSAGNSPFTRTLSSLVTAMTLCCNARPHQRSNARTARRRAPFHPVDPESSGPPWMVRTDGTFQHKRFASDPRIFSFSRCVWITSGCQVRRIRAEATRGSEVTPPSAHPTHTPGRRPNAAYRRVFPRSSEPSQPRYWEFARDVKST